jgi:hypothetical protein
MLRQIKQYVPSQICLRCDVCCRFLDRNSSWAPIFTKDEIDGLLNVGKIPPCSFSKDNSIRLLPYKDLHICNFFCVDNNKCIIYPMRPFDCRLYPFILTYKDNKVFLGVDTKCPFVSSAMASSEFKEYVNYLIKFFSYAQTVSFICENSILISRLKDDIEFISMLDNLSQKICI